ncbi:MAG: molecular chaperone HtpG [Clostridia bacterium]|nr:molecular chaperone HtpG [Clostridia bacterium]
MAVKQFKAESRKLLDLMINSIYTNKEIFLRELISNASDAVDKLHFRGLTDDTVGLGADDYAITLIPDKETRTLRIVDNGIGMTAEELENNLGTIAKSGSLDFKTENSSEELDIIGQFGVGFYSAFMVASKVTVVSRAYGSEQAWKWESEGADGYTIEPAEKNTVGTDITLTIKENTETENYDRYLEEYGIQSLVKKYSDYIRYPIRMMMTHSHPVPKPEDAGDDWEQEYEEHSEMETLNSMVPIWKRKKGETTDEEYAEFYKTNFYDFNDPAKVISASGEGAVNYNAVLFIPASAPYDFYTKEFKKGLALYSSGVMIMEKCEDLLPDYFNFVRGVVDSSDLSLNISRELLQQNHQLKLIRKNIEKKIKSELLSMCKNDREKYEAFWKSFGRVLKFGVYSDYGAHKDVLTDLIIFYSAKEQKMITLTEYVEAMPEAQKYIYFAASDSVERAAKLPNTEAVLDRGFDVLLCTDDVDEFCLQIVREYKEKSFKNVGGGNLELETEEEKEAAKTAAEANKGLLDALCEALGGKVKAVKTSSVLKEHPVALSSEGPVSIEMEKVLKNMPGNDGIKSEKVLEINENHAVFTALKETAAAGDSAKLSLYAGILYEQARLIEGLPVEDPIAYAKAVCSLMK